jgi:hypothetical protein
MANFTGEIIAVVGLLAGSQNADAQVKTVVPVLAGNQIAYGELVRYPGIPAPANSQKATPFPIQERARDFPLAPGSTTLIKGAIPPPVVQTAPTFPIGKQQEPETVFAERGFLLRGVNASARATTFPIVKAENDYLPSPVASRLLAGALGAQAAFVAVIPLLQGTQIAEGQTVAVVPVIAGNQIAYGELVRWPPFPEYPSKPTAFPIGEAQRAYPLPLGSTRLLGGAYATAVVTREAQSPTPAMDTGVSAGVIRGAVKAVPVDVPYYLQGGGEDEAEQEKLLEEDRERFLDWYMPERSSPVMMGIQWELGHGSAYSRRVGIEDFAAKAYASIQGEESKRIMKAKAEALEKKREYDLVLEGLKWGGIAYLAWRILLKG